MHSVLVHMHSVLAGMHSVLRSMHSVWRLLRADFYRSGCIALSVQHDSEIFDFGIPYKQKYSFLSQTDACYLPEHSPSTSLKARLGDKCVFLQPGKCQNAFYAQCLGPERVRSGLAPVGALIWEGFRRHLQTF